MSIETVFRYANVFEKSLQMLETKMFPLEKLISKRFSFEESTEAFAYASEKREGFLKLMVDM